MLVAVPSHIPLQETSVVEIVAVNTDGSVIVTESVTEQPLQSVTVYVYVPAGIPVKPGDVKPLFQR